MNRIPEEPQSNESDFLDRQLSEDDDSYLDKDQLRFKAYQSCSPDIRKSKDIVINVNDEYGNSAVKRSPSIVVSS